MSVDAPTRALSNCTIAASSPQPSKTCEAVAKAINAIDGVMNAEHVTGPYDVIVRAEAKSIDDLAKVVLTNVQTVKGITRTLTCPIVNL